MKLFSRAKDGGQESHVTGYFLIEIKPLFSVVLLHFVNGTRDAFHSHAFHAITWILSGEFREHMLDGRTKLYKPSLRPKITARSVFHKVFSYGDTWALSFRGPWKNTWQEFLPKANKFVTLTHGRKQL
jgi:hypothetical protein